MRERVDRLGVDGRWLPMDPDWRTRLLEGESVHRELRAAIGPDYVAEVGLILAEGAFMAQLVDESGQVAALALWRVFHTTYCGRRLEIDDLVTAAAARSRGHGSRLLRALEARAVALGCPTLTLNSAVHRRDAHRFYVREGYEKFGYHFSKTLAVARPT